MKERVISLTREQLKTEFLKSTHWAKASIVPVAPDASFRKYDRLLLDGKTAFFMDSPLDFGGVEKFIKMAEYLCSLNLSAPIIFEKDTENGFLISEDLGDDLYSHILKESPSKELELYKKAASILAGLHKKGVPDFTPPYSDDFLLSEVELFTDWYMPALTGQYLPDRSRADFLKIWQKLIADLKAAQSVLVLRDYHADNLIDLKDRSGDKQVGLLDFQDALKGHAAYDLVSLLKDVRRDVTPETERNILENFILQTGEKHSSFTKDYMTLGLQRNLKILGIFARQAVRDGNGSYLKYIPKLWRLISPSLDENIFSNLKKWLDGHVPIEERQQNLIPKKCGIEQAFILAAGLGTRMRPLTDELPKPLIKVAGSTMLSQLFHHVEEGGVKNVIMNMHHKAEKMIEFADYYPRKHPSITLCDERSELLDSGGGIKRAVWMMKNEPFFVLNGDFIIENTSHSLAVLKNLSSVWRPDKMDILMLVMPVEKSFGYEEAGDFYLAQDKKLTPRAQNKAAPYIYTGIMIIKPQLFDGMENGAFSLRLLFDKAYGKGMLYGHEFGGNWYHIGRPEMRLEAEKIIKRRAL